MSRSIVNTIEVRCSVRHAFDVFTSKVDLWWPVGHRAFDESVLLFEAEVGGRFLERSANGEEVERGKVLSWEPPHRIAYSWHPGAIDQPTEVEVIFEGADDRTVVTVTHAEAQSDMGDRWAVRAKKFQSAWDHLLVEYIKLAQQRREP